MKKLVIIISSLLMVALVAGNSFAYGQGQGKGQGKGQKGSGFNQDCQGYKGQNIWNNLSQEQRDEVNVLRQTFIDETYEMRSAKFQKKQQIRMLMETSNPDRAELGKLSQEISDLQKQIRDKKIDFLLAARKISPELGMGMGMGKGFGQGQGNCSKGGGQRGWHGQGSKGCYKN